MNVTIPKGECSPTITLFNDSPDREMFKKTVRIIERTGCKVIVKPLDQLKNDGVRKG